MDNTERRIYMLRDAKVVMEQYLKLYFETKDPFWERIYVRKIGYAYKSFLEAHNIDHPNPEPTPGDPGDGGGYR